MAFTHVQGNIGSAISGTTVAVTLAAAPTAGNLVACAIGGFQGLTLGTVKDSNNNSYTITASSPEATRDATAGSAWMAYLLSAPANATATITATFSVGTITVADIWAEEFSITGGSAVFDKDAKNNGTGSSNPNTPSLTPTNANSLLYATASTSGTTSGVGAPWTQAQGGISAVSANDAEYDLSATGATAINFTCTGAVDWDAMSMAFFIQESVVPGWESPTAGPSLRI